MFDGFKTEHQYLHAGKWLNNSRLVFPLAVNEQTGEIMQGTRIARHNGLTFRVYNPDNPNTNYNELLGSLHKYHNGGTENANDFSFNEVVSAVKDLALNYHINPETSQLKSLEIGVNVALPFPVSRVLKACICYNGTRFQQLDRNGLKRGLLCNKYEYEIKLYDKSNEAPAGIKNLLRFELRVRRMRYLQAYGIKFLADITNPDKVVTLGNLLTQMCTEILMCDVKRIPKEQLTIVKQLKLANWLNPDNWEAMKFKERYKQRLQFDALMSKYGANTTHFVIANLIAQKWQKLLPAKHKNGVCFHRDLTTEKSTKKGMFSHLEYTVKSSFTNPLENGAKKTACKSCGKELIRQKINSIFCSEKIHGKKAKSCRNKDSNKRYRFKQKIKTAIEQNRMIAISYADQEGNAYTDTLRATEICVTREWLEQIQNITLLETDETMQGKKAKDYLTIKTKHNEKNN